MSIYQTNATIKRGMSQVLNNSVNNYDNSNQKLSVNVPRYVDYGMISPFQPPRNIRLDFYDSGIQNPNLFQQNFNLVINKLNLLEPNCQFTGTYQRRAYLNEINEPCLMVNNEHCICHEKNFKIINDSDNDYFNDEEAAKFLLQSIKLVTKWKFEYTF